MESPLRSEFESRILGPPYPPPDGVPTLAGDEAPPPSHRWEVSEIGRGGQSAFDAARDSHEAGSVRSRCGHFVITCGSMASDSLRALLVEVPPTSSLASPSSVISGLSPRQKYRFRWSRSWLRELLGHASAMFATWRPAL